MNDNGLPHAPLSAAQFGQPAISRLSVPLNFDRTNGEFLPNVSGDYLRVDSCDLPARISFNNTDFSQSVALVPGLIVEGNFAGVTIYHDNYTTSFSGFPTIVFSIGRSRKIYKDNESPILGISSAYRNNSLTVTGSASVVPAPLGYSFLIGTCIYNLTNSADVNILLNISSVDNLGINGSLIRGPLFTRKTRFYNRASIFSFVAVKSTALVDASRIAIFNFEIPVPVNCEAYNFAFSHSAVTSVDDVNIICYGK